MQTIPRKMLNIIYTWNWKLRFNTLEGNYGGHTNLAWERVQRSFYYWSSLIYGGIWETLHGKGSFLSLIGMTIVNVRIEYAYVTIFLNCCIVDFASMSYNNSNFICI